MSSGPKHVVVEGAFDDLRSGQIRFLQEAAKIGEVTIHLWSDELVRQREGRGPKFPEAERAYFLRAIRFVSRVQGVSQSRFPSVAAARHSAADSLRPQQPQYVEAPLRRGEVWAVRESEDSEDKKAFCNTHGLEYHVVRDQQLAGFPETATAPPSITTGRKRVLVTGCYDWVHSGHVRFFEEVSAYGDLYVVLGHDANLRLLKGPCHPLFPEDERRYVVGAIRYVTQALIATGHGWLDAEPEIQRLKPHIYAVNDDGDKGGKREYCARAGIEYLVLKRTPAPGLPPRTSTNLRGF